VPCGVGDAYRRAESLATIARRHGVEEMTVSRWLGVLGIKVRANGLRGLTVRYESGESVDALAEDYSLTVVRTKILLARAGAHIREDGLPDPLVARRREGVTVADLAADFGINYRRAQARVALAGLTTLPPADSAVTALVAAYTGGMSLKRAARTQGFGEKKARRVLAAQGVPLRNPGRPRKAAIAGHKNDTVV